MEEVEWTLYYKLRNGVPVEFEFGPKWKAKKLELDGGYPTKEEAKEAWMKEYQRMRETHYVGDIERYL